MSFVLFSSLSLELLIVHTIYLDNPYLKIHLELGKLATLKGSYFEALYGPLSDIPSND